MAVVEGAAHVLAREPAPLGEALAEALRRDGIEIHVGVHATAARREGDDYVLELDDGRELRGERLLVATGRRPRVEGIGLETVGITPDPHGIPVDAHMRAGDRLWAIGDVTGVWPLTHVGEYEGEIVAANILGEPRPANYEAVPRVTYTDPQAAAVGAGEAAFSATAPISGIPKAATYTHAYAESNGYLTLLSDGERLTGAHALGPEAGEWLQQATLAIRARVPLEVLYDTIQPFPSFSEIHAFALRSLRAAIAAERQSVEGEPDERARGPDRGGDRRQRRHRVRDGPPGTRRGGRGDPDRPQPRAPGAGGARARRASTAAFDAGDVRRLERVLRRPAAPGRPHDGHRGPPVLRAAGRDGLRGGAPRGRRGPLARAPRRPPRRGGGAAGRAR